MSRRARVQEKKNLRKAYLYIFLSIAAAGILFFLGLPLLVKFASFFTNLGKSEVPVEINDITPPAPPQIEKFDEFTNKKEFKIKGKSEEGAAITLYFNNKEMEAITNSGGEFSFETNLKDGKNSFYATAKDNAGNISQETSINSIIFDNEEPELVVESPSNEDSFYGNLQRQISIKGGVSDDSEVYINDRFVTVSDDGSFSFTTTLDEGINTFEIKAIDKAKNETSTSLSVNFSS